MADKTLSDKLYEERFSTPVPEGGYQQAPLVKLQVSQTSVDTALEKTYRTGWDDGYDDGVSDVRPKLRALETAVREFLTAWDAYDHDMVSERAEGLRAALPEPDPFAGLTGPEASGADPSHSLPGPDGADARHAR